MAVMLLTDIVVAIGSNRLTDCESEVCDDSVCVCMGSSIGCVRRWPFWNDCVDELPSSDGVCCCESWLCVWGVFLKEISLSMSS